MGDGAELALRLDVRLETVPLWSSKSLGDALADGERGFRSSDVVAQIGEGLARKLDVIVLANFDLTLLPDELRRAIVEKVEGGTGIVVIHEGGALPAPLDKFFEAERLDATESLLEGVGADVAGQWRQGFDIGASGGSGGGRVVELVYRAGAPMLHCLLPSLSGSPLLDPYGRESYFAPAVRSVMWAGGWTPAVRIEGWAGLSPEGPKDEEIPPDLPEAYIQLVKEQAQFQRYHRYEIRLDRGAPKSYQLVTQIRHPFSGTPPLRTPWPGALSRGMTRYPFYALAGSGTHFLDTWILHRGNVVDWRTDAVRIQGWPRMESVTPSKNAVAASDSLDISVSLSPRLHQPIPTVVRARAIDAYGRVVASAERLAQEDQTTINVPLGVVDLISGQLMIQVTAAEQGVPADPELAIRTSPVRAFHMPVRQRVTRGAFQFAALWPYGPEPRAWEVARRLKGLGVDTLLTPYITHAANVAAEGGLAPVAALWSIEDNGAVDLVRVRDQIEAADANGIRRFWVDGVSEGDGSSVLGALKEIRQADKGVEISVRMGADDAAEIDWYGLSRVSSLVAVPADSLAVEKVRSYWDGPSGSAIRLGVDGASMSAAYGRWAPWYGLLHGMGGVWHESPYGNRNHSPSGVGLDPEGGATASMAALAKSVNAVSQGLDVVIDRARREHSGIAIYDRGRAVEVESLWGAQRLASQRTWMALLEDVGFQYDFVADEGLSEGSLDDYKVLILPVAVTLSDDALAHVARFSAMGGTLVADGLPGIYDELGRLRTRPVLADVFGVDHDGPLRETASAVATVAWEDEDVALVADIGPVVADSATGAASARASGNVEGVPVWLVNERGAGHTLVLNHLLPESASTGSESLEAFVSGFLRDAGAEVIAPRPSIKDDFEGEVITYRYGDARIAAYLRHPWGNEKKEDVQLRFAKGAHVYDLIGGTTVRKPMKTHAELGPGDAAVFVKLPYEVAKVQLSAPREAAAGRRLVFNVAVKTVEAIPGEHVVRITLAPSGGDSIEHYSQTLVAPGGAVRGYIPLAQNEKPGWYTLGVQDVLSGMASEQRIFISTTVSAMTPGG
jgi:hypothetical protein